MSPGKWTLVQHSGFGYGGNPQFSKAVESRPVRTAGEERLVTQAGGILLGSYTEAEELAFSVNYPDEDYAGLIPDARGAFSDRKVDGLRVYIPVRQVTG